MLLCFVVVSRRPAEVTKGPKVGRRFLGGVPSEGPARGVKPGLESLSQKWCWRSKKTHVFRSPRPMFYGVSTTQTSKSDSGASGVQGRSQKKALISSVAHTDGPKK